MNLKKKDDTVSRKLMVASVCFPGKVSMFYDRIGNCFRQKGAFYSLIYTIQSIVAESNIFSVVSLVFVIAV